jgi:hypothetical protein
MHAWVTWEDKTSIDSLAEMIANDGGSILDEIDVEHPGAKMMVDVPKTQDDMVGDGTTTAVVLAGEILKKAEEESEPEFQEIIIRILKDIEVSQDFLGSCTLFPDPAIPATSQQRQMHSARDLARPLQKQPLTEKLDRT